MIYKFHFLALLSIILFAGCSQKRTSSACPNTSNHTSKARYNATMKAYKVLGRYYVPKQVYKGEKMYGISSWYGPNFHGKCTSNGEKYNMYARTAAHKTLPMDTIVRVKNLQNGKSTVVRINDRGPFVKGRIIDCSYKAGKELGLDKMGIAKVEVEVLKTRNTLNASHKKVVSKQKYVESVNHSEIGIQLGAFHNYEGAHRFKKGLIGKYSPYYPIIHTVLSQRGDKLYKVILVGFTSEKQANVFKNNTLAML